MSARLRINSQLLSLHNENTFILYVCTYVHSAISSQSHFCRYSLAFYLHEMEAKLYIFLVTLQIIVRVMFLVITEPNLNLLSNKLCLNRKEHKTNEKRARFN